eukprot:snap_masked-scaffold_43-processed-gene-1.103-mRNA-1 protein AED:1.00 eAED:1.00 QI:0/-1/0/0/-1/1/1/0/220
MRCQSYIISLLLIFFSFSEEFGYSDYEYEEAVPECTSSMNAQGGLLEKERCCASTPYIINTHIGIVEVDIPCLPMNSSFGRPDLEPYLPYPLNNNSTEGITPPTHILANENSWCPIVENYNNYEEEVRRQWGYCYCSGLCTASIPTSFPTYTFSPTIEENEVSKNQDLNLLFWFTSLIITCPCLFLVYLRRNNHNTTEENTVEAEIPIKKSTNVKAIVLN